MMANSQTERLNANNSQAEPLQHAVALPPDVAVAFRDAQRNVANARWYAFEDECFRLGEMVRVLPIDRILMIDLLQDMAEANGLVRVHGIGLIQLAIVAGLRGDA